MNRRSVSFNMHLGVVCFVLFLCASAPNQALGMAGSKHDYYGELLLDTPASQGGAMGMSQEKVGTINRWMDYYATTPGEFTNSFRDAPVSPRNHSDIRHNPRAAARALSGTGRAAQAELNVARVHKIADVATYKAPSVDRIPLTPEMQREAQEILDFVENNHRLPRRLPSWVDERGGTNPQARNRQPSEERYIYTNEDLRGERLTDRIATLRNSGAQRGVNTGAALLGIWFALRDGKASYNAITDVLQDPASMHKWMVLTEQASSFVPGAVNVASTTEVVLFDTARLSMVAERLGYVGLALFEVAVVVDWQTGGMTTREFWVIQGAVAGGLAGGWAGMQAGAALGAAIGSIFPGPGTAIGGAVGAIVGSVAGGYYGAKAGQGLIAGYYASLDREQQRRVDEHIYAFYQEQLPAMLSDSRYSMWWRQWVSQWRE
jgi:hypothetical protein